MIQNHGWIVPDWPAPSGVRATFTTRQGPVARQGASTPPWDRFNLGDHVGDDPMAVAANRRLLRDALSARPVFLKQVHGTTVVELDSGTQEGTEADGVVTLQMGVACTVMVADCLPVLFTNAAGSVIGAAHAGWRGLAEGVLERTVACLQALDQTERGLLASPHRPEGVMAWLGPCIGPQAFEVGAEVREAFMNSDANADTFFESLGGGKYLADLPALARRRLGALGVKQVYGNDGSSQWCTVANSDRFFSHRRDQPVQGTTGRLAACIWRSAGTASVYAGARTSSNFDQIA